MASGQKISMAMRDVLALLGHGTEPGRGRMFLNARPPFPWSSCTFLVAAAWMTCVLASGPTARPAAAAEALDQVQISRGVCAVVGLPGEGQADSVTQLAQRTQLLVYFQSPDNAEVAAVRKAAQAAGLLGNQVFVNQAPYSSIHLADNLADAVIVGPGARAATPRDEILRVLHPEAKAMLGDEQVVKPFPSGTDDWSHLYHGPDNNPQSSDQIARAPYLTQFLADPLFVPMPEVSVAAGGRVFRAFGHIAHKANQNAMLNTLIAVNGYNGTILWKRPLKSGFMIHRNTLIATPSTLYLADDESCKLIDARTGKDQDEIVIPAGISDGPVWKWMALQDDRLFALVGGEEIKPETQRSLNRGLGHWPWGMWQGHDYKDPRTNFGFGRTFVALDPATKEVLWSHREKEFLDSRGVCMKNDRIYFFSPNKFLGCLDAKTGELLWKNDDRQLLDAIGADGRAQHYVTGYSTTNYIKCSDDYIFFAGPQRPRLVVASTEDGRLLWKKEGGNLQLVLRDDGLYAAGPQEDGSKLAYATGQVIENLPARRACTRATGSVDSVFYRTSGGTVRLEVASNKAHHIAPMRPPCQDGVIISDGLLYWGPWMCGCQLSLYGHICLGPAGSVDFPSATDPARLEIGPGDIASVRPLDVVAGRSPADRGDLGSASATDVALPTQVESRWSFQTSSPGRPTAPVTVGGLVFLGDESGTVWALDAVSGKVRWQANTGGAVYFAPAVWNGRLFVGSADGRVYAFEAATGRRLWSFLAAPANRWITVYGKLMSTWPVAGGVVVDQGVVYAAAGIAHYDGTYVYALDAVTGKLTWCNDSSGAISPAVASGVSLQGQLTLRDGELRFLGGGAYETARYDLQTGKCLNPPRDVPTSQFHTAFYPYFPEYGKFVSLDHLLPDGKSLIYDASYEGSVHSRLALFEPLPPGASRPRKEASRWYSIRRRGQGPKAVWQDRSGRAFGSFVVGSEVVVAAGQDKPEAEAEKFLTAIRIQDGSSIWRERLPAAVVKNGLTVDSAGRIFVTLDSGKLLCFEAASQ
jgi:outer membrane protein assembly factor BamB